MSAWPTLRTSRGKRPADPEAQVAVPAAGGAPGAEGRAEELWTVAPGTAANDPDVAVASCCPRRAVGGWISRIAIVPAVLHPFPDIAVHVVQAECIGGE